MASCSCNLAHLGHVVSEPPPWRRQQSTWQCGMYRCHAMNISTWLDGKFVYPVHEYEGGLPCTSTWVLVLAEYSILLCTMCILVAKGRQMIVTLEA